MLHPRWIAQDCGNTTKCTKEHGTLLEVIRDDFNTGVGDIRKALDDIRLICKIKRRLTFWTVTKRKILELFPCFNLQSLYFLITAVTTFNGKPGFA